MYSRSESAVSNGKILTSGGKAPKLVHYTKLQHQPIELSYLEGCRNRVNLITAVPTYFPLDSDRLQENLMYKS